MVSGPEVSHLDAKYETVSQVKVPGTMSRLSTPNTVHGQSAHAHQGDWRPAWATLSKKKARTSSHWTQRAPFTPTIRGAEFASHNLSMV